MMKVRMWGWVVVLALASGFGCRSKDLDVVSERAGLEAEKQIEKEKASREKLAGEMEMDLSNRQRFFQAVRGVYEGEVEIDGAPFQLRVRLIPSIPPYRSSRVRQLDEIENELTNLHFSVEVKLWSGSDRRNAVGCHLDEVHPDLVSGRVDLVAQGCPTLSFSLSHPADSAMTAAAIMDGKQDSVAKITGTIEPATTASISNFSAARVSP
jgi:hypothetical protein